MVKTGEEEEEGGEGGEEAEVKETWGFDYMTTK